MPVFAVNQKLVTFDSVHGISGFALQHVHDFNAVNVATATHRIASGVPQLAARAPEAYRLTISIRSKFSNTKVLRIGVMIPLFFKEISGIERAASSFLSLLEYEWPIIA
jgi:hypothetical protein